jgi:dTMP kinase
MRGFFLVLEGPEGAGKSTLAATLTARARSTGSTVVAVREPGGTTAAEAARAIVLDHSHAAGPETELLLMLAARADLVRKVIRPALEAGSLVIADRFDLSTKAYQVAGRGLPADLVSAANRVATGGLEPDLTLVLDVAPEAGRARQAMAGMARDRMEAEGADFHARVAAVYLAASGPGVQHLNAELPADRLAEAAWAELAQRWRQT